MTEELKTYTAQEPQIHFGTGGWRAIISEGFTQLNVQRVAQALAARIISQGVADKPVVIGYDQRSAMISVSCRQNLPGGAPKYWPQTVFTCT